MLEDDQSIAQLFTVVLQRENFDVQLVSTKSAAISQLESDRFHLVVVDLMVPDHDKDVIGWLKHHRLDVLKSLIVASAHPMAIRAALEGSYPEPICKFIAKPFDIEEFVRLVHSCKQLCNEGAEPVRL